MTGPGGGVCSRGEPGPGGSLVPGGVCSGGCLVETPRDGYCYGLYVSYWNAFLFSFNLWKKPAEFKKEIWPLGARGLLLPFHIDV